jgi:ATP-dependent Clp protease ATP-binding subunit ClpA
VLRHNTIHFKAPLYNYIINNVPKTISSKPVMLGSLDDILNSAAADASLEPLDKSIKPYHLILAILRVANKEDFCRTILESNGITKITLSNALKMSGLDVSSDVDPSTKKVSEKKEKLPDFLTNLNSKARTNKIDPLIGRENEVERVIQILSRRKKNNPILVGEPGVGKTAIAEGLALRLSRGDVPEKIKNFVVYSLDVGTMISGTKFRGDFEEKMKILINLLEENKNAVLFIDEIHTIVGAGSGGSGGTDAANMLKPKLASGELKVIGATTYGEYRNIFEKDHALARRFQKIDVVEPTTEETIQILKGLKPEFEKFHGVSFTDEAIEKAVELSAKHINDRFLPDKAIDVLDEAGAIKSLSSDEDKIVGALEVEKMIAKIARIPEKTVTTSQKDKIKNLREDIKRVLFGQDLAIEEVVSSIELNKSGLSSEEKPLGSFLFCGPTGVGKTELVKQLANNLGINLLRFDMSEYGEKHTVSRLIGAPPGYVGFDKEGELTGSVHKTPHSIVLLDEIEKAHPDIYNILLQVMDHGILTDSNGKKVNFKNTIIVMTSNVGAREASQKTMGFSDKTGFTYEKPVAAVERHFTPEFRNRLDAIVYFNPLSDKNITAVLDKCLLELDRQLILKSISLDVSESAKKELIRLGFDPSMGARPMARTVKEKISKPLAKEILHGKLSSGGEVLVDFEGDFVFNIKKPKKTKKKVEEKEVL